MASPFSCGYLLMLILKNNLKKKNLPIPLPFICVAPAYVLTISSLKTMSYTLFTMLSGIGKSVVDWPKFNLCTVMSVGPWHWNGCWFLSDCLSEIHDIKDIVQE